MKKKSSNKWNIILAIFLSVSLLINIYLIYDKYFVIREYTGEINILELYQVPTFLRNYREQGFNNTFVPIKNPFGGGLYEYTQTTATYGDRDYQKQFGMFHDGIDLIPNKFYYENSQGYFRSKKPVVFSTINGTVKYLYDEYGANYLVITNDLDNTRVLYVHLEASFVKTDDRVVAGQPVGIMGQTGKATGKHLHYEVQIKDENGNWKNEDPNKYITQ